MTSISIPFNRPAILGDEFKYIEDAIVRRQLSGDGYYTEKCQDWIAERIGCAASLLTHSCTAALEMSAILADIQPGDEVIMPSFTFVSTANAVALRGARPVFVDIREDTLNLDEELVAAAVTEKTKAIFTVHYAGVCSEMDKLCALADEYGLWLIEDAAQSLGSTYQGKEAGSLGHLAAISFHETKNVTCGEGGALVINDPTLIERAEIIREKGTNRKRFFRGEVDKYTWVEVGSSFLPGELNAAFLYGQLEKLDAANAARLEAWNYYSQKFRQYEDRGVRLPVVPQHCVHNGHLFYLLMPSAAQRNAFIAHMKSRGILTPFHYVPLHSAPAGKRVSRTHGPLRVTNDLSSRLVRLPLFYTLGSEIEIVVAAAEEYLSNL